MRSYRGSRRRSGGMRPVIQSFKKVLEQADVSVPASFRNEVLVAGVDSVAAGQISATDPNVPTGAIIKYIELHFSAGNQTAVVSHITTAFQYTLQNGTGIDPILVGGHLGRNQVMHMSKYAIGPNQNGNRVYRFKIPKAYQRVREGRRWIFSWRTTGTINFSMMTIYKFYR